MLICIRPHSPAYPICTIFRIILCWNPFRFQDHLVLDNSPARLRLCYLVLSRQDSWERRMDLKIFGPSGVPDNEFKKGLHTLLESEPAWNDLAQWFLTTESFEEDDEHSSRAMSATSLLPEQFFDCVYALRFILEAWQIHHLRLLDIQRDLFALGYDSDAIDRLGGLLQRIEPARGRVYASFIRSEHENAILPTLEDLDVVCDLRPIFEDYVFPAPVAAAGVDYKRIMGFSCIVLVELVTEDSEGRNHRLSFQMTEKALADLQSALGRAHDQLDILKASTRELFAKHD